LRMGRVIKGCALFSNFLYEGLAMGKNLLVFYSMADFDKFVQTPDVQAPIEDNSAFEQVCACACVQLA
jgi:hypothetical protein